MRFPIKTTALVLGALALSACSEAYSDPVAPDNLEISEARSDKASPKKGDTPIAQIVLDANAGDPAEFTLLAAALGFVDLPLSDGGQNAGLVDLFLNGRDQYTVFAPTDQAFLNLIDLLGFGDLAEDEGAGAVLSALGSEAVLNILLYHVAEGRRGANSVLPKKNDREITPLLGEPFFVRAGGSIEDGLTGFPGREDAMIVGADISASNGIIHVINQVIVPPSIVAALS